MQEFVELVFVFLLLLVILPRVSGEPEGKEHAFAEDELPRF